MKSTRTSRPARAAHSIISAFLALGHFTAAHESALHDASLGVCLRGRPNLDLLTCSVDGTAAIGAVDGTSSFRGNTSGSIDEEEPLPPPPPKKSVWQQDAPCYHNASVEASPTYCVFTDPSFADGHGISVVTTAKRANSLAQKPAFSDPDTVRGVNRDFVYESEHGHAAGQAPLRYRVEAMPGKGYGLVATQPIGRGDLIMSTTPSILFDYDVYGVLSEDLSRRLQIEGIDSLPPSHHTRYMNLSTHDGAESTHQATVAKILDTNAFEVNDGGPVIFSAVFPEISRLNHDCRPNADYFYDHDTMTQHVHAVRPIAAGEEITISYIDLVQTRQKRLQKLKAIWGFPCSCSLCTRSHDLAAASDARIKLIQELRDDLQDHTATSRASPQMAELLISLYEQEGMDAVIYEAYVYAAIEWSRAGDRWQAVKYANLAIEYGLISIGAQAADVEDMENLVANPKAHWSWLLVEKAI